MTSRAIYSLDDAIAKTDYGKFNFLIVILSGFIMGSTIIEISSPALIVPLIQCEFEISNSMKGFLMSAPFFAIVLSSNFWGFLADTHGRKRIMVPALFAAVFFSIVSSFSNSYWFFLLFRFLNGLW
jgi:MFS transporter, VNT family, synaptic vesicle glycoprotein 2